MGSAFADDNPTGDSPSPDLLHSSEILFLLDTPKRGRRLRVDNSRKPCTGWEDDSNGGFTEILTKIPGGTVSRESRPRGEGLTERGRNATAPVS